MRSTRRFLGYLWAGPNTVVAIGIGLLLAARFQVVDGAVEIYGPAVRRVLLRMPVPAMAMTVGHAIFGVDRAALERARSHEHVHVRQYCRWGVFFIPAYLACSAWLFLRRRDGYRENPFEIEAYGEDGGTIL